MRTSITLIHGSILSYCYHPPPHRRDFQIIHYFIVYSTSLGIKYWWAPWLLGCKKMLLLVYFWKTQTSQCKSVTAPRGTGRKLGELGDWATGSPSSLQGIFSIWPNSLGIVGIVHILYMEDWRSSMKSKYIALTSIYLRWEKYRKGMGVRFWVRF